MYVCLKSDYFHVSSSVTNHYLMRSLSRYGSGWYEFYDTSTKSKWEAKVCVW